MAGVVVVEGLCGVNEPDPMQLLVVVMLWLLGVGDFGGGGGGLRLPCSCGCVCYRADICRGNRGVDGCAADDVHEEGMLSVETIGISIGSLSQSVSASGAMYRFDSSGSRPRR